MSGSNKTTELIQEKIDFLRVKYGKDLIFKYCCGFCIENTSSEELIISDFIDYSNKKKCDKYRCEIYIGNCKLLKKINCDLEGIDILRINNCPNLEEIDGSQQIQNLSIDGNKIEQRTDMQTKIDCLINEIQVFKQYPGMIELLRQRIEKLEKN